MKKLNFSLSLLLFSVVIFLNPLHANPLDNVAPTARLMDNGAIVLDANAPLSNSYEADVSHYSRNISNQEQGQTFLDNMFKKEYVVLTFDYSTMKVTITLNQATARNGWTVADWNKHLRK